MTTLKLIVPPEKKLALAQTEETASVSVPGSKYVGNRLLFLAALAEGESQLMGLPENEDLTVAQRGLAQLGTGFRSVGDTLYVKGNGGQFSKRANQTLYAKDSGTFSRFVAPFSLLTGATVTLTGSKRLEERPMGALFIALRRLGGRVAANRLKTEETLPAELRGPLQTGAVTLPGTISSQFFSALLISAPYAVCAAAPQAPTEVTITSAGELVSRSYLKLTIELMKHFGVEVRWEVLTQGGERFSVASGQRYKAREYCIEADPVSASYFMAVAALTGGRVRINNFNAKAVQGESKFPQLLEKMGCTVVYEKTAVVVQGPAGGKLKPIKTKLTHQPDITQTLAVLCAVTTGTSELSGIAHLRHKEANRIEDTARQLRQLGVRVVCRTEGLVITGGRLRAGAVAACGDHRMAMSLSLLALRLPHLTLYGAEAVRKSFPAYFEKLRALGFVVEKI